jgi:hypothetical protein
MTVKDINGTEVEMVKDANGNCMYYVNPAKTDTKMSVWNDLFGIETAKIMRANYLSHAKNGYTDNGQKVRNIRDFDGNIIKTLDLKDTDGGGGKTKTVSTVNLKDAIAVYKEISAIDNPALKTAVDLQMTIIKQLIPQALLDADIDTLKFIIDLKTVNS